MVFTSQFNLVLNCFLTQHPDHIYILISKHHQVSLQDYSQIQIVDAVTGEEEDEVG